MTKRFRATNFLQMLTEHSKMPAFNGLSSISSYLVYFFLLVGFGDAILRNGSVILSNECDWNTYDNTHALYETEVKSRIKCAAICFQYGIACLGFQLLTMISETKCRLLRFISLENCTPPISSTSVSFLYKRTDVQQIVTTQPVSTLAVSQPEIFEFYIFELYLQFINLSELQKYIRNLIIIICVTVK